MISGPAHQTGAASLAARAALRAGAGLVTMAAEGDAVTVNANHLTAVMIAPYEAADGLRSVLDDRRKNAVAIGPGAGIGDATSQRVETILSHPNAPSCVLDADAITSFEGKAAALQGLIKGQKRDVVLTPHEGEYQRLFIGSECYPESVSEHPDSNFQDVDSIHEGTKRLRAWIARWPLRAPSVPSWF